MKRRRSAAIDRNQLTVSVETSEFPGETVRVTARWNDRRIVLRLPDLSETDELTVGFAPEDAHVVAPE